MKIEASRPNPEFQPITLTITIESKQELEAFYRLGDDSGWVSQLLSSANCWVGDTEKVANAAFGKLFFQLEGYVNDETK